MSALRKFKAPEVPNAGHRWDYMKNLLTSGIGLSSDARLLLYTLLTHDGDSRTVNPGIRRLVEMTRLSIGRVLAARDELLEWGLISEERGSGTRSSVYRLAALDAWFEEWVSVRNSRSSVRNSGSSVPPVETKPSSNPSKPEKGDGPDLRIVPTTGWHALKMQAPDDLRQHWLDKLTLDRVDDDGRIFLTASNPAIADRVRNLLREKAGLKDLAQSVGVDPDKVKIRAPRHGVDPLSSDLPVMPMTQRGMDEKAQEIEDKPDKPVPTVYADNTVSLEAYRTRRDDALREVGDEAGAGVPVGDAEVAGTGRDDAGPECPCAGGDNRPGAGRPDSPAAPHSIGGEAQPGLEAGGVPDSRPGPGGDRALAVSPSHRQPAAPALDRDHQIPVADEFMDT
jgi:hypothetical protein